MKNKSLLSKRDVEEIKILAEQMRGEFGISDRIPIGNNLRLLIESKGLYICEYPFQETSGSHTDAAITIIETEGGKLTFLGLNTSLYYDEQLFALAHELYHYATNTGMAYEHELEQELEKTEQKADRFAAELLLPETALNRMKVMQFDDFDFMSELPDAKARLLRIIATIQCTWYLPYQSIVRRFWEVGYITNERYNELYSLDVRNTSSDYYKIFCSVDKEKCELLNKKTKSYSITNIVFEIILKNFEDGYIDEDELVDVLKVFGKTPSEFGISVDVLEEDDDFDILFGKGDES